MLRLKSLGQTLIEIDDARLTPAAETLFATALYLVMEAGKPISRDDLARLIWPGVSEARAQHGLRQVLYKLRSFGAQIVTDRTSLELQAGSVQTDFGVLLKTQHPPTVAAHLDTVGRTFLPGYRPQFSNSYSEWLDFQRDLVHTALSRALVLALDAKKCRGDWLGAERLASEALAIDPLNEEATLTIAEAAALGGNKSRALSILNDFLAEIGSANTDIRLPAISLRRRISEAFQNNTPSTNEAPLEGREEEMAELMHRLARAQRGHGSSILVWGESGIGKTRLVAEFTRVAALQQVQFARVRCQPHDVARPLSAFVDLVPALLALPGALGCAPETLQFLKRLTVPRRDTESEIEYTHATDGIFERLRAAVIELFDSISNEVCIVIHFEDSQWLDTHSRSVLESLQQWSHSHRVLILVCCTTDSASESMRTSYGQHVLPVKPLSRLASLRLANHSLSQRDSVSTDFRDWCVRSGYGNPFFVLELAAHAADDGSFTTPPSLAKLIDSRVDSLSPLSRSLLRAVCILGRHSTISLIESVLNERRIDLLQSLDDLQGRGFVDHEGDRLTCRHDLISKAALNRISSASRSLLHHHAACALEPLATNSNATLWDCAEHWRQAGETSRAVSLMTACAQQSLGLGLPLEAASMLETAAGLAKEVDRSTLLRASSAAYGLAGSWSEAKRVAQNRVDALRAAPHSEHELSDAELRLLISATKVDAYPKQLVEELLSFLSSPSRDPSHRFEAAIIVMMAADNLRDRALAERVRTSLNAIHDVPKSAERHRDHCMLIFHCSFGDSSAAIGTARRLLAHAHTADDASEKALYLEHIGVAFQLTGDTTTAHAYQTEALEIARANYLYSRAENIALALADFALDRGELAEAKYWHSIGAEESAKSHRGSPSPHVLSVQAELYIREGRTDDARLLIQGLDTFAARVATVRARARQASLHAHLKLESSGKLDEEDCVQLLSLHRELAGAFGQDYFLFQLVRGLASLGREHEALDYLNIRLAERDCSHEQPSFDLKMLALTDVREWNAIRGSSTARTIR